MVGRNIAGQRIERALAGWSVVVGCAVVAVVVGCGSTPPPSVLPTAGQTATPSGALSSSAPSPSPSGAPGPHQVGPLELEECDPLGYIPCEHQAARLAIPIAGTGVMLTYSSEWAPGRLDRPVQWDPTDIGLGGWSLDVLHRYDEADGIDLDGRRTWRFAERVDLGAGNTAVPTFDGRLAFVFDGANRHVRTVDAVLGVDLIAFEYDDAGRLSAARGTWHGRPVSLSVERANDGAVTGLIGAGGALTRVDGDGLGHIGAITHPDGTRDVFIFDGSGLLTMRVDPAGGASEYGYDAAGRLVWSTDPDGVSLGYGYSATDGEVQVTVSLPVQAELMIRSRRTDSGIEKTYVGLGGPTRTLVQAADGGRVVSQPDGTTVTLGALPDVRWGLAAPILSPITTTRADGATLRTEVSQAVQPDGANPLRVTAWSRTTLIDGNAYVERFDPAARTLTMTDPLGRVNSLSYDDHGRVVAYRAPGQPDVALTYDSQGRVATYARGSAAAAQTTSYSYGEAGQLTISQPGAADRVITLDATGRAVSETTGAGSSVLVSYDAAGRPVLVRPGSRQSTAEGYTAAGRRTAFLPPGVAEDASYELVSYDDYGRVVAVNGPGSRQVAIAFDTVGRIATMAFDRGQLAASYDPQTGRLSSVAAPDGVTTTYSYVGRTRSSVGWSGPVEGRVSLVLDPRGRPVRESIDDGPPVALTYDRAGGLVGIGSLVIERDAKSGLPIAARLGAAAASWQYDVNGRLEAIVASADGGSLREFHYARDGLGRVTTLSESGTTPAITTGYAYDATGRLASVTIDGVEVENDTYDAAGNRVSATTLTSSGQASYDARDQLRDGYGATFSYDGDGTLASRDAAGQRTAYDFDDLGALRRVVLPDGRAIEYDVDWSGLRLGRRVNGQPVDGYLYRPSGQLVAQLDGSGAIVARFAHDPAGRLISMERDGKGYLVVTDAIGSPRLVLDALTGAIVEEIEYDAWGRVLSDSNPGFQPFGFAGGLRDLDTGLVHFGVRDYDPTVGRWVEPDPIRFRSGAANLYVYAANDPVNRADTNGLQVEGSPPFKEIGCAKEGYCWQKDGDGNTTTDMPPGWKIWFCEDGFCSVCGDAPGNALDCQSEPYDQNADPANAPQPYEPPEEPPPSPGGCVLAIYCGNHLCIGLLCYPPGGGVCFFYCSTGDPHLRTADGVALGFQGAGEYLMIGSADGNVAIQARQQPPAGITIVSVTTALAASVAGDRVGLYLEAQDDGLVVRVNGSPLAGDEASTALPHGGSVVRHGTSVVVEWPDGSRLMVNRYGNHLDYSFNPDSAIAPTLTGLMGSPNGQVEDDLVSRDGGLVLDPAAPDFYEQLHGAFGDSWRISQAESLFDYGPGESTATFTLHDIPRAQATVQAVGDAARAAAEQLCRAVGVTSDPTLSDCIVDVGLTGDPSYAASAAAVEAATDAAPPKAAPKAVVLGQVVAGTIAPPDEVDVYVFSAFAGQAVYLDAIGPCTTNISWRLMAPSGTIGPQIHVCKDLGRQELAETGTYTIEVFAPTGSRDVGPYAFAVRAASSATQTPLSFGTPVNGQVAQVGDQPRYQFSAPAGQIVLIDALGPCVEGLFWELLDPAGAPLTLEPVCVDIGRAQLAGAGTYTIEIYSDEAVTGPFSFTVYAVPQPRETGLVAGVQVSDQIATVGERHRYTFTASAGQVVTLDASGPCTDGLVWLLVGPLGDGLASADTCANLGPSTLTTTGTHTVEIYSLGTATGPYAFVLTVAN